MTSFKYGNTVCDGRYVWKCDDKDGLCDKYPVGSEYANYAWAIVDAFPLDYVAPPEEPEETESTEEPEIDEPETTEDNEDEEVEENDDAPEEVEEAEENDDAPEEVEEVEENDDEFEDENDDEFDDFEDDFDVKVQLADNEGEEDVETIENEEEAETSAELPLPSQDDVESTDYSKTELLDFINSE